MSIVVTEARIRHRLANAFAGEVIMYFRGFLAMGKADGHSFLREADRQEVVKVASYLWRAAQHGHVHLLQIRHSVGDYTYLAVVRRSRAVKRGAALLQDGESPS